MRTAAELFYKNGYRATGINEVIDKSGVAKATFYSHFPSKDDLCLAYLQERNRGELQFVKEAVARRQTPREKLLAVIEILEPWLVENKLRGCGFLNMVAEEPDPASPLRLEGKDHYEHTRQPVSYWAKKNTPWPFTGPASGVLPESPARWARLRGRYPPARWCR